MRAVASHRIDSFGTARDVAKQPAEHANSDSFSRGFNPLAREGRDVVFLKWTLFGVWIALTEATRSISHGRRLSPVRALRAFAKLVVAVSKRSRIRG